MPAQQSASNHTAFDPLTHFIIGPLAMIGLAVTVYLASHTGSSPTLLRVCLVLAFALLILLNVKTRLYSLRIQDRLIRLEEHLRLADLVPAAQLSATASLTTPQLIALRFASDAELPTLAILTATENLAPKEIKAAISTWRPDLSRI